MDIKYALLGFLSWKPATGYELKKLITEAIGFEWSGNNNQIYTSLVQLHRENLATIELQPQEHYPTRKMYSITEAGRQSLKEWILSNPEPPAYRKSFLVQLAWADQLGNGELEDLLEKYQRELEVQILMLKERIRRGTVNPARTHREKYLWEKISENYLQSYDSELKWVKEIRHEIDTTKTERII
jgi:PadR family transcriptional regulator, regulatory protein AphA